MFWHSTKATFRKHEAVFDNVLAFDFSTRSPPDMHCVFPSSPSTSFCRHPIPRLDVDPVIYRHLYGPGEDKNFWKKPHGHLLIPDILGNSRTNLSTSEGALPGITSTQVTWHSFRDIFPFTWSCCKVTSRGKPAHAILKEREGWGMQRKKSRQHPDLFKRGFLSFSLAVSDP